MSTDGVFDAEEHEGPIRELMEEMREWYIEQFEEAEVKAQKVCLDADPPLPHWINA